MQYTLKGPKEFSVETIVVVGAGDAAIKNALASRSCAVLSNSKVNCFGANFGANFGAKMRNGTTTDFSLRVAVIGIL